MRNESDFVTVPIWSEDADGAILPNPLFHRPWDKLHSRCVEYPYAAHQIRDCERILDVGTAKSDAFWQEYLCSLPLEVHATDYDALPAGLSIPFHQCDVRATGLPDSSFDLILAVSVIEHIGLESPQVDHGDIPQISTEGDLDAVRELTRLLRPRGRLVMTFPFASEEKLIADGSARCYSASSLNRLSEIIRPEKLDYYEYQHRRFPTLFDENPEVETARPDRNTRIPEGLLPSLPGRVTWRRRPLAATRASHNGHIDGVLCGTWLKE